MASSCGMKRYHVFPSFHGPDVRRGFLSHLHNHFASKGITTFKDNEIVRGHTIGPELVQAIGESRVSIVVLSKKYASSSWCLDELVEILKCKETQGQIVITIFYDVNPSDVRKQSGVFGSVFEKTCEGKSEEVKQSWIKALAYVATIAGEHSLNWDDEAAMVEKIATDVSTKLNVTLSRDFDGINTKEQNATVFVSPNKKVLLGQRKMKPMKPTNPTTQNWLQRSSSPPMPPAIKDKRDKPELSKPETRVRTEQVIKLSNRFLALDDECST